MAKGTNFLYKAVGILGLLKPIWVLKAILPERLPTTTQLLTNYSNPFNPETWIPFQLSQDAEVRLTVYGVQGQRIRQPQLGLAAAGRYVTADQAVYWDGKSETG